MWRKSRPVFSSAAEDSGYEEIEAKESGREVNQDKVRACLRRKKGYRGSLIDQLIPLLVNYYMECSSFPENIPELDDQE